MIDSVSHVVSSFTHTNVTSTKTTVEHIKHIEDRGVQRIEVSCYTTYNKQGEETRPTQQGTKVDITV